MYHIKPDKRSQASAQQIVQGLQACLKHTPLKSITMSDLHRSTGISRATIYRLFDTPEDILVYQLDQMTEATFQQDRQIPAATSRELLEDTIALGLQNHEFLKALVDNGRHDLLFRYTEQSLHRLDERSAIFSQEMDQREREYLIAHLSMGMVSTQITWARNGQKETPADMMRYLKHYVEVLSGILGET